MAKASEKYEVMYIINPNFTEEQTAAVVEKFKALVEANGTLDEMEEMGKRKLAYEGVTTRSCREGCNGCGANKLGRCTIEW